MDIGNGDFELRVNYTSEDGITYTKTEGDSDYELPCDISVEEYEKDRWNDVIGQFIKILGNEFGGLFKCKYVDDILQIHAVDNTALIVDKARLQKNIYDYFTDEIKNRHTSTNIQDMLINVTELKNGVIIRGVLYYGYHIDPVVYNNELKIMTQIMDYSGYDVDKITFDFSLDDPITDITVITPDKIKQNTYLGTMGYSDQSYYYVTEEVFDKLYMCGTSWLKHAHNTSKTPSCHTLLQIPDNKNFKWNNLSDTYIYQQILKYLQAPSQLSLANANELLPGKIGYGKNGIVIGDDTVFNNFSPIDYLKKHNTRINYFNHSSGNNHILLYNMNREISDNQIYSIIKDDNSDNKLYIPNFENKKEQDLGITTNEYNNSNNTKIQFVDKYAIIHYYKSSNLNLFIIDRETGSILLNGKTYATSQDYAHLCIKKVDNFIYVYGQHTNNNKDLFIKFEIFDDHIDQVTYYIKDLSSYTSGKTNCREEIMHDLNSLLVKDDKIYLCRYTIDNSGVIIPIMLSCDMSTGTISKEVEQPTITLSKYSSGNNVTGVGRGMIIDIDENRKFRFLEDRLTKQTVFIIYDLEKMTIQYSTKVLKTLHDTSYRYNFYYTDNKIYVPNTKVVYDITNNIVSDYETLPNENIIKLIGVNVVNYSTFEDWQFNTPYEWLNATYMVNPEQRHKNDYIGYLSLMDGNKLEDNDFNTYHIFYDYEYKKLYHINKNKNICAIPLLEINYSVREGIAPNYELLMIKEEECNYSDYGVFKVINSKYDVEKEMCLS